MIVRRKGFTDKRLNKLKIVGSDFPAAIKSTKRKNAIRGWKAAPT
jgi:hypothetical protein